MPSVVDSLNLISSAMDDILNFIANDETLSNDFQQYLEKNNVEVEGQKDFNNVIIQYALDMKMQNGLRVLEYYRRNSKTYDEIIDALLNSFCSVFKIEKVLSNAYEATCLTSNAFLTLIPMVKMTHLKQIGRYDYIQARIIELDNVQYILEIYDVISEFNPYQATVQAIKFMLLNPKSAYYKNEKQREKIEKSIEDFNIKFEQYFKKDFIVTTNKKVDLLIEAFNKYRENIENVDYRELIEDIKEYKYIKIDEFECDDESFMQNAIGGFSSHKETYDVALWMDKKRGLYIIPFLETFFRCFEGDVEGKNECIREFLTSDKIPPSVLKYALGRFDNFFDVINKIMETDFSTLEEVLFNTKTAFIDSGVYSPTTVLFNSDLFSSLIGLKDKECKEKEYAQIGRNDPCPCGSGLKYKNCCGKN